LLGVAASEAVDAKVFATVVREAFEEERVRIGEAGDLALLGEPPGGVGGEVGPAGLLEDLRGCGR
jgi:hypothetical protein